MGAERKYTDRDVRENATLYNAALEYIDGYQGEFEFLIDCKMRRAQNMDLSIGMIRGILNCMRVDPRVKNLPEPSAEPNEGVVVSIKRKKQWGPRECDITDYHDRHKIGDPDEYKFLSHCPGIYRINRTDVAVNATIKPEFIYVMSRTGKMIHKHKFDSWYMYRVNDHKWGWWKDPDFYVRTACKYPRMIDNPIIFGEDRLQDALEVPINPTASKRAMRILCPRCFP